jgi:ribosomal protein S7
MISSAKTVKEYLNSLPPEHRPIIEVVRQVILDNLPKGYVKAMSWGMITYEIPLERYPNTYNKQPLMYVALASQKRYISLYLMNVFINEGFDKWFRE